MTETAPPMADHRLGEVKIRSVIPPAFIRFPASKKNGIASKGKAVGTVEHTLSNHGERNAVDTAFQRHHHRVVTPMDNAAGIPTKNR